MNPAPPFKPDSAVEIAPGVHWIGVLDPGLRSFDIILKSPNGTSYNAYVVRGSEGVAVIDTVKACFSDDFFRHLESVANYDEITTIVLNHLEPDHSGALPELLRRAPQAKLYISTRGKPMLKGLMHGVGLDFIPVKTGDFVSLGDRTLSFLNTPYLHWPDTQCTWLEDAGLLFSGDVFGSHFCDARLFNDAVGDFRYAFDYYYAHLMRPFRSHVLEALQLIEPLPVKLIAPAHGPVLRDNPCHYLQRYRELSASTLKNEASHVKTLLVFYLSAYGNTKSMAEVLAAGAESAGGVRVSLYDIEVSDVAPLIDLIEEADALVFGSPTINGDAVKPVWDLLSSLTAVSVRGKMGAAFGSYGWSGEAVPLIEDRLRGLKLRVPLKGIRARLIPTPEELAECRKFGVDLALHLTGKADTRIIDMAALA
ncbi:MAG: FprA family A-type flavoprotein [Betaproteobacteria bacterium]